MGAKKTFCQISSGIYYSVAIDNRGLVWGWGYNLYGQLGDNSVTSKRTPVSILGAKKTFCQINAAQYFTTSIDQYGLLWTWGLNNYGQLGINSSVYKCTPVSILGNRKTFCSVKSKYQHTLAIDNRGLVWGWGYGRDGQLWDKTTLSARTPVSILGSRKTFCSVGTGLWHGIGIDNNGYTWTWGLNNYGQLGNYYILSVCTPVSIKGAKKTFCKVDTGTYNVVTIDYKGQVWSWGYNAYGQLGNNATQSEISPVSILGVKKTFCEIAGAYTHSLGIDNRGLLWAWGYNNAGQLGVYSVTSKRTPVSILGAKKTFCQISSGDYFSIAIDNRGLVWGWGNDIYGQLGDYSITCKCTPLSIMGAKKTFCQINSDYYSVMGIDNRGLVWSWGYNNYGQLGDNSITNRCTPVSIMGAKKTFCKIDVGYNQSSAIDYKGQVWSWGYNAYGQLGDNSVTSKRTPVSILGAKKTFCSIVSGAGHSLGLDNRGQVWVWGLNNYGQLGDNVTTNRSTPISIMGAKKTFCQIHAGYTHSIAVDNRGIAWGWGGNGYGQVGFRRFDSLTPVRVCTI
jgi:alpha-tubulin suppressor-like RCC1 family protein